MSLAHGLCLYGWIVSIIRVFLIKIWILPTPITTDMQQQRNHKPFPHKVQDQKEQLPLSTAQKLLLLRFGAIIVLILAAMIDITHQLLSHSLFGLTLIILCGSIMVAIVQIWGALATAQ
ncbi:hypothetical protein EDD16DRAFT_1708454 [Pisolithus croceorrhizus]|nr:hypothetical protein EDD16DRAFT_1708454 [Pisolithus croceorrhizus]KAI6139083.1 hypothetical protein EDD17DRAFT_1516721 [Pisolithus thermaeus]